MFFHEDKDMLMFDETTVAKQHNYHNDLSAISNSPSDVSQ